VKEKRLRSLPRRRRLVALFAGAVLLAGCATAQMEAQWRDPQAGAGSIQGKAVLVMCRGLDLTLERICEDRLAADAQAAGIHVVRSELPRDVAVGAEADNALLGSALAAGADAVLLMRLQWSSAAGSPSGGSVGVGVGAGRGTWGGTSGAIGITLPIGDLWPALAAGASLTDATSGKLLWSGRTRGSGAMNEPAQVGELSRLTIEALSASGLF